VPDAPDASACPTTSIVLCELPRLKLEILAMTLLEVLRSLPPSISESGVSVPSLTNGLVLRGRLLLLLLPLL